MHAVIVVAHPDQRSHTHAVAAQLGAGLAAADAGHTFEIADLAQEGFDPRFTRNDVAVQLKTTAPDTDIAAEHARLDRADALILVYPIYWWSFPALLKGWIDRVFTQGWAYEDDANGRLVGKLARLRVHLLAIGGADQRTYARHGYFGAMKTQIDHGIFGYCGARVQTSELLLLPDPAFPQAHYASAHAIGRRIFCAAAATRSESIPA
ncbi:NAD(P)H-dependent oxidoreductase [Xanthomonas theicola]|uniref:NAD(P)H oxidoreductase n=1 Tax=Xanthomonas theicola TaxID=56464 RepID=A0A2S6ZFK9_9XANT|nr:NAD(P)H-dependent oxidoreductase [Xanthomonas theicola]PPT91042.1 NAD(P)H oxidoreductase [Xanthomonas theicola]QNH25761.1 NAD(P)H-dependent oxidoreductase [Xanthomonas theicola]